jgi:hypothetical protein
MRLTVINWLVIAFFVFVFGTFVWDGVAERRGRAQGLADAHRDLEAGKLGRKGIGKSM